MLLNNLFKKIFRSKISLTYQKSHRSSNIIEFKKNLKLFTKENIETIVILNIDQNKVERWFKYRQYLLTG